MRIGSEHLLCPGWTLDALVTTIVQRYVSKCGGATSNRHLNHDANEGGRSFYLLERRMQDRKTSRSESAPHSRGLVPGFIAKTSFPTNEVGDTGQMVPFDPLDEFVFSMQDPNAATREKIAAAARDVFGGGAETTELVAGLVEHMMAVSESRSKVVAELIVLGGHLQQVMTMAINYHIGRMGDTPKTRKQGATLGFAFFERTMNLNRGTAYSYMRCHQKFADKAEAVQMFSYGELRVLAAQDVTDSEIEEMRKLKEATPDLNRADIAKLLKALRMRDEELADKDTHVANIEGLLADSKLALDQSSRENAHLKQKIAEHEKEIFEQEKNVATLSEMLARNSAGYPALEKALADKEKELVAVADQLKALQAQPPKLERVEVPVETLPASYASLREALDSVSRQLDEKVQEKRALDERTAQIEKRLNESQAALDARLAVKEALTDLTASWSLIAAKMATVQLAVQASANPVEFNSTLEAMAATMRKYLSEIEAALQRTQE